MTKLIKPKIVGELKIITNKAGSISVYNDIKSGANRIMIPCRDEEHGKLIIKKIINAKTGELLHL